MEVESKSMKLLVRFFYVIVLLGIIFGIYYFLVDKYTIYMVNDVMILNEQDIGQIELLPKNSDYFDLSNYVFKSSDEKIVVVDNYGFVQGLKEGNAYVKVRYKNGISSQKIKISVEKVTINSLKLDDTIELEKNSTKRIKPIVNNDEKINANLNYTSSDETILKIDDLGNVTGLRQGTAKIIVSSENGIEIESNIKVVESKDDIEEIRFLENTINMDVDDTKELQLDVYPINSSTSEIEYKSSNPDIVSIDSEGYVSANDVGYSIITATTRNGLIASCVVISGNKSSYEEEDQVIVSENNIVMYVGEEREIIKQVMPPTSSNKHIYTISENSEIVSVSTGALVAKSPGQTIINVKTDNDNVKESIKVTVKEIKTDVDSISINNGITMSLYINDVIRLSTDIKPESSTNKKVKWTSNNEEVARVTNTGMVVGVKRGNAVITAESSNGKKSTINVVVRSENNDLLKDLSGALIKGVKTDTTKNTLVLTGGTDNNCKNDNRCLIKDNKDTASLEHNTKALQKAYDDANNLSIVNNTEYWTVLLPAGTYYFTKGGGTKGEKPLAYSILLKNNVHLVGAGNDDSDESKGIYTRLKPYGQGSKNFLRHGLTMFFYIPEVGDGTLKNVTFEKLIIDSDETRGFEYTGGGGKGIFIVECYNCHWSYVTIRNTDATGFGMDLLKKSTIKNCVAEGCGKNGDISSGGASGFGIGTQKFDDESLIIEDCVSNNNQKFGFFFESQNRWGGYQYDNNPATASKGNIVINCSASGNLHNYGGLRGSDVVYINNTSSSPRGYHVFFSDDSRNTYVYNMKIKKEDTKFKDVNKSSFAYDAILWAESKGLNYGSNESTLLKIERINERFTGNMTFQENAKVTRAEVVTMLWRLMGRQGKYIAKKNGNTGKIWGGVNTPTGFNDVSSNLLYAQAVKWAKDSNVVEGTSANKFSPNDYTLKRHLIIMLYRLYNNKLRIDVNTAEKWARDVGIIDKTSSTQVYLTRAQAVVMLYRYYSYVDKTNIDKCPNYTGKSVVKPSSIKISSRSNTLAISQKMQMVADINPCYTTNRNITWSSSDDKIATVNSNGVVQAISSGKVKITATASNGKIDTYDLTVVAN